MEAAVIIVCLVFSAFFSGMEIAYVSANKVYLGVEKNQSTFMSRVLARLTENPTQFITTMLLGNTVALVVYAYHMGLVALRWLSPAEDTAIAWQVLFQVLVSGFIILLTAEFIPKVFFQVYANTLIKLFAIPAYAFFIVLKYPAKLVIMFSDLILVKLLGTTGESRKFLFERGELGTFITEQVSGTEDREEVDSEIQIFRNAMEFSDRRARDIMTPRTEIEAVEINAPVEELERLFIESGYSKMIVYEGNIDNISGYVHSFGLFKKPDSVRAAMIPTEHVPGSIFIKELLDVLTRKRKSLAVILDEYGGTAGIVTVEDIIEELFGEILDEHDDDPDDAEETELEDGAYIFSARLDVAYVNTKCGLSIPESEAYTTLGGLAMHYVEDIPQEGGQFAVGPYNMTVQKASSKKIELVKIEPLRGR